ncbi:MAG: Na+/H+ antiporter NhaA [Actinobacteria bacterium]|nr:Na+/H+ antiporter NhaA [Actinomycetota bacterium]
MPFHGVDAGHRVTSRGSTLPSGLADAPGRPGVPGSGRVVGVSRRLPDRTGWTQIVGLAALVGIGFTVSPFVTDLASATQDQIVRIVQRILTS